MDFLKGKNTVNKDLKANIPTYKHILANVGDSEMIDWLFSGQTQIDLTTIFDISTGSGSTYKIELFPPCLDTWIPYQIYLIYGFKYSHPYISYIGHLDKESVLKANFEKKVKKSIMIGLTEDKKKLEGYLKLDIPNTTKIMIIHKLIFLGEKYSNYVNARNRRDFVDSIPNHCINNYKDDIQILEIWHEIKKTKLIDIIKSLNDTQKTKYNYQPYLSEIISNLDKKEYQEIFDIIKVGIDYNKPIDRFAKKFAFAIVPESPQLDYIIRNTDIKEVIKKGFLVTPDNYELFMKLANKKEIE
jgi:hypothetical protein